VVLVYLGQLSEQPGNDATCSENGREEGEVRRHAGVEGGGEAVQEVVCRFAMCWQGWRDYMQRGEIGWHVVIGAEMAFSYVVGRYIRNWPRVVEGPPRGLVLFLVVTVLERLWCD
jgi:hypothetical protein